MWAVLYLGQLPRVFLRTRSASPPKVLTMRGMEAMARSNWLSQRQCVGERAVFAACPEVVEDDYTCDRRVGAPQRGEGVALERHYNQENGQVSGAENHHGLNLGKKQRTAGCNHIQDRDRRVICGLIDVNNTVSPDVHLQRVCN